jgi:hypothetical protein
LNRDESNQSRLNQDELADTRNRMVHLIRALLAIGDPGLAAFSFCLVSVFALALNRNNDWSDICPAPCDSLSAGAAFRIQTVRTITRTHF